MLDTPITTAEKFRAQGDDLDEALFEQLPYPPGFPYIGNGPCTEQYDCLDEVQFGISVGFPFPTTSPYAPGWTILSY